MPVNTTTAAQKWNSSFWEGWTPSQWVVAGAAVLATVLFISSYSVLPGLRVFGHDEVHYYASFVFKLREDGRWLNFLLDELLRSIPLGTWAVLLLVTGWCAFFRLARAAGCEPVYAVLVASTIMVSPPFAEQSLWPATTLPALLVLLGTSVLVQRRIPYPVVYLVTGVFMFGVIQSFYFLVPLFFLHSFISAEPYDRSCALLLLKHMVWWVLGSVLGVLVMSFALWIKLGTFGVEVAEWRAPQPIGSVDDLIRNVVYVWDAFVDHIRYLLAIAAVERPAFFVCAAVVVLASAVAVIARRYAILVLIAVALSFFAFSIPLAPHITGRSLVALAAAVVMFVAVGLGSGRLSRAASALLLLCMAYGFALHAQAYLVQHQQQTSFIVSKLEQLMPDQPDAYAAIAIQGRASADSAVAVRFNDAVMMHGLIHGMGVNDFWDCRGGDARCESLKTDRVDSTVPFLTGTLEFSVDKDQGVAVIRVTDNQ